ncbi:sensor histidine kinase [Desulfosporosinus shakirovi]|uniref:sensor histidine kinase n=1 Tax=Desulfosporosinus shakirovi TaxID=2885154 RepID=UPI001E602D58|nr:sensor histidine kinase [Desulfosporosinus sp. SRJS8]MCB8815415.1 sensor histidine kinase [Desulfosporosinus sp. SRJS8]
MIRSWGAYNPKIDEVAVKSLLKLLFLIYIIALFAINGEVPYLAVLVIILIIGVNVFKERFYDTVYTTLASFILICVGIWIDRNFALLLCIPLFDFTYQKAYGGVLPVGLLGLYFAVESRLPALILSMGLCGILALVMEKAEEKESNYKHKFDEERRLRYELERTKSKLLNSAKDIAHLTEVSERNRIAREIHDNVGHGIAGILIQLQAAYKLLDRDEKKSQEILERSIENLSDALTLLRNTVHNIKPKETLGVEYLKSVINNFGFCPVELKFYGDFGLLASSQLEILGLILKEALTNAAKHSKATRIDISIDINDKFARLYIKDNGIGSDKLKEGLGISGMKERVLNIGGTISISSTDGFLIVCLLPMAPQEGWGVV